MNSRQLRWILSNDKVTSRTFKGVFALDEIVHIKQKSLPSAYVFNLDPSYKPGSHWVALQSTLIGKDVLNISILLDALPQKKSKTFCIPVKKAGNTITYPFKNFILRHVVNLLCFIFIKDVLV